MKRTRCMASRGVTCKFKKPVDTKPNVWCEKDCTKEQCVHAEENDIEVI